MAQSVRIGDCPAIVRRLRAPAADTRLDECGRQPAARPPTKGPTSHDNSRAPGSVLAQDMPDWCLATRRTDVLGDPGLLGRRLRVCGHVTYPITDHRCGGRKACSP